MTTNVAHYDLIGLAEAADLLGVAKSTVLVNHKGSAIAVLSCGPLWLRTQFTESDAPLTLPQGDTFIGFRETLAIMGISHQGLRDAIKKATNPKQQNRRYFPLPLVELRCGPIWLRSQVEGYKKEHDERKVQRQGRNEE